MTRLHYYQVLTMFPQLPQHYNFNETFPQWELKHTQPEPQGETQ